MRDAVLHMCRCDRKLGCDEEDEYEKIFFHISFLLHDDSAGNAALCIRVIELSTLRERDFRIVVRCD